MAVTRAFNVKKVTADNDTIAGPVAIESILYLPGTGSPDAKIKQTDTNGMILWDADSASTRIWEEMCIHVPANETLHFDLAGTGTVVYIYEES